MAALKLDDIDRTNLFFMVMFFVSLWVAVNLPSEEKAGMVYAVTGLGIIAFYTTWRAYFT